MFEDGAFRVFIVQRSFAPFVEGRYVGTDPHGLAAVAEIDLQTDSVRHFPHDALALVVAGVEAGALQLVHTS